MSPIDEYLSLQEAPVRALFTHIYQQVRAQVPDARDGKSYGMPALLYNGKGLLSVMANKQFLSVYPFSGWVIDELASELQQFECTKGSVHFSVENPLPDNIISHIVATRLRELTSGR
jgi:uncharacterized protein YdhG (YjbR/CyaY superfamily)